LGAFFFQLYYSAGGFASAVYPLAESSISTICPAMKFFLTNCPSTFISQEPEKRRKQMKKENYTIVLGRAE
jgi:hypothetical protein